MSQEAQAQQVPLIVQYQQQLIAFKQQRDIAKVNLEQLNGAIFACEHMIKQYEDCAKQTLIDPALGAINDGKVNDETEKQIA
jgi:hypothetical protein